MRPGPGGQALLAYHGAEIPYVFNTQDVWLPTTADDAVLTDAMVHYWSNFARSGNPNGNGKPLWVPFTVDHPTVQELGVHIGGIAGPDYALCHQIESVLY